VEYKKVWADLWSAGWRNDGNHVIQQCIAESYVVSTVSRRCVTFLEIHITSNFRLCFSRCAWISNLPLQGSSVQTSRNGHHVQIHCFLQTYLQTCNYIKEFLRFWAILNGIKSKKIETPCRAETSGKNCGKVLKANQIWILWFVTDTRLTHMIN